MPKSRSKRVRRQPPPKPKPKKSPPMVAALVFTLFFCGVAIIVGNYMQVFGVADNWRLFYGLGLIFAGAAVATRWH